MRVEAVVGKHNGLGILEFGERLHVKAIVGAKAVGLRSREIRAVGNGLAGQQADMRVVAAFREVVAGLEPLLAPAEPARGLGREIVREREEHFGSKGLHQSSPGLPRQRGLERTEALRGDDGYAFGLPGQAEELQPRSEEHTSELQSQSNLVCRLLLEKKKRSLELCE